MMSVTKEQYFELVANGAVPVPKTKSEFLGVLKMFMDMGSSGDDLHDAESTVVSEEKLDVLTLKVMKTPCHKRSTYLSSVKKDLKRKIFVKGMLASNQNAIEDSIKRIALAGKIILSSCGKRYKIAPYQRG